MPSELPHASSVESHRLAAEELVRLSLSQDSLDTMVESAISGVMRANPALRPLRPVFDEFFATYFTIANMVEGIAPLYVERFSELELTQMVWFYSTPVGARALSEVPELMRAGAAVGEQIVQDHQTELEAMLQRYISTHPTEVPGS
jgi:hypothetical protein